MLFQNTQHVLMKLKKATLGIYFFPIRLGAFRLRLRPQYNCKLLNEWSLKNLDCLLNNLCKKIQIKRSFFLSGNEMKWVVVVVVGIVHIISFICIHIDINSSSVLESGRLRPRRD